MTIQIDSNEDLIKSDAELPTEYGNFRIRAFVDQTEKNMPPSTQGIFQIPISLLWLEFILNA